MTSIVMIVHNRYRLTEQAIKSVCDHTPRDEYTLTLVDDASDDYRVPCSLRVHAQRPNGTYIRIEKSRHVLSHARNVGAYWSEQTFGLGQYFCFLDNDVYVFDGWLHKIRKAWIDRHEQCVILPTVLGGCQHPYHKTIEELYGGLQRVDAVAGYSMFMGWCEWKTYGPFRGVAGGVGQSEDFEFCQRINEAGGVAAYIHPPVLTHCGVTNSDGKPATGADQFPRIPSVLYL